MRYTYYAQFVADLAPLSLRLERKPILGAMWRVVKPLFIVCSYLGFACAVFAVETLPLQTRRFGITPNTESYWVVSLTNIAALIILNVILAVSIYRRFRKQLVDIDLIVIFVATVVALWLDSLVMLLDF